MNSEWFLESWSFEMMKLHLLLFIQMEGVYPYIGDITFLSTSILSGKIHENCAGKGLASPCMAHYNLVPVKSQNLRSSNK